MAAETFEAECVKCGEVGPHYASCRLSNGCRTCVIKKTGEYAKSERGRETRKKIDLKVRLRKYNLTEDQYNEMFAAQGGRCGCCGTLRPTKRGWHIDHDHACCPGEGSCGECVRGILCARCNIMLGYAQDNAAILLGGIEYLSRWEQ